MTENSANENKVDEAIDFGASNKAADSNNDDKGENITKILDSFLAVEMEKLKSRCNELEDQALRQRAEHENSRKAIYKDADKRVSIAVKKVVSKFFPVMGAFSQGLQSAENATDVAGVLNGMKMVESMFSSVLMDLDVQVINPEPGTVLDPAFHQAISKAESSGFPANSIVTVISKGYTYQGLLLEPAMVIVSA